MIEEGFESGVAEIVALVVGVEAYTRGVEVRKGVGCFSDAAREESADMLLRYARSWDAAFTQNQNTAAA